MQDECIPWWRSLNAKGYGILTRRGDRRQIRAHRFVWEACFGFVADEVCVLHRCDNPACVNPNHLFLGTKGDNNRDAKAKGRSRGKARLTPDQVQAIRESSESQTAIGVRYGISQASVSYIKLGKSYRWYL